MGEPLLNSSLPGLRSSDRAPRGISQQQGRVRPVLTVRQLDLPTRASALMKSSSSTGTHRRMAFQEEGQGRLVVALACDSLRWCAGAIVGADHAGGAESLDTLIVTFRSCNVDCSRSGTAGRRRFTSTTIAVSISPAAPIRIDATHAARISSTGSAPNSQRRHAEVVNHHVAEQSCPIGAHSPGGGAGSRLATCSVSSEPIVPAPISRLKVVRRTGRSDD